MKSRIALIGSAAVFALTVSACGGGSGDSSSEAIEFQTGLAVDASQRPVLEELTGEFEDANPDIDIDLRPTTGEFEKDIKVRLASGDVPDIFWTHGWSRDRYSEFLEPLGGQPWAEYFNPSLEAAMKTDDGEFFALPVDTDIAGIIYNATVLGAAGVAPEDITTWEAFDEAAQKVLDSGATPISVGGKDEYSGNVADWIAPGAFNEEELAQMEAGEFVAESYSNAMQPIDEWREKGYYNPDYVSATGDDMARAFAEDKAAFAFTSNSLVKNALAYNPDAQLGFIPVPSLNDEGPYLIGGERNAYGVAKDSDQKEAALKYLEFLAEPENLSKLATAFSATPGLTNAESDLGALQTSFETYVDGGEYPLVPYFDRVYLPNGMWDTMVTTTDALITGQSDPAGVTEQMAADFSSLFGQE
ncbi:raffinose/stachyose/melibiose transport system substrate-binding protein [Arthrobacter pigmenti]|uniref:Raffinose/stachyose/melibiose transport system substrate-binding protein n=1 Tax=Arthrobacter pigmenti TaxID=271432 RepID=A0A846RUY8_9MICC|nr:ABC transporter substrate-binding protein [Arthrobacter pigmenti]NJC24322.1 raffinose/stachyose/melibiose transport system substrate-binding protein [Arthrobacter pigmenti]